MCADNLKHVFFSRQSISGCYEHLAPNDLQNPSKSLMAFILLFTTSGFENLAFYLKRLVL